MSPTITVHRGEPLVIAFAETSGDSATITSKRGTIKRADAGWTTPAPGVAGTEFAFTDRAAADGIPKGFNATLTPAQTRALTAGNYVVNFAFGAGGTVQDITSAYAVLIKETTTEQFA